MPTPFPAPACAPIARTEIPSRRSDNPTETRPHVARGRSVCGIGGDNWGVFAKPCGWWLRRGLAGIRPEYVETASALGFETCRFRQVCGEEPQYATVTVRFAENSQM